MNPSGATAGGPNGRPTGWAVVIPAERYEAERLFHHDTLELTGLDGRYRPAPGDPVLVVATEPAPMVVATGRVSATGAAAEADPDDPQYQPAEVAAGTLVTSYLQRTFDEPVPADRLVLDGPVTPLDAATYRDLAGRVGPPKDRRDWLVSLALPIEAATRAEAVRLFWSYLRDLGPRELPVYVSPAADELAMQAYVLGVEANQDPEEDDE